MVFTRINKSEAESLHGLCHCKEQGYKWLYRYQNEAWYATMNRRVYQGKKLLGIQGFNNHDFRTTYGTQLKESGMTSAQVADLMGHADTRMVETVYARAREEGIKKRRGDLEKMNKQYAVLA